MKVTKIFTFDAAHNLPNYNGKCRNLHGHTYKLEVTCQRRYLVNGMIVDFNELKNAVDDFIISKLDHTFLNDVLQFETTAENMAYWMLIQLKPSIPVYSVKLWETPTSYAEVTINDL